MDKTLKNISLIIIFCLLSITSYAQYTSNGCNNDVGSGASISCQTSGNISQHHIEMVVSVYPDTLTATPSGTVGLSYTRWQHYTFTQSVNYNIDIWCGYTGTNSGVKDTVTISYSPSSGVPIAVAVKERTDVTYTSCATAMDTYGTGAGLYNGQGTSVPTFVSSSVTSTNANDTTFATGASSGAGVNHIAAGTGFNSLDSGVQVGYATEWKTITSAGTSTTAVFTNSASSSQGWGIAGVLLCPGDCNPPSTGHYHPQMR